ncbi:MAG: hypothetical protein E6G70_11975 [Alphaproteobacteria bacterium]|nr:MAG: hypothetical protein E6G70_11975 [Alphaproteobacteria bacterium]
MRRYLVQLALLTLLATFLPVHPSHAKIGFLRVTFTKAGLVAGAGLGRGVLTYDGREYPFRVSGLSLGLTIGASTTRLVGRASYLSQLNDFAGTYTAVGGGAALAGGVGGVQLKNEKGVIITLQGPKAGVEFSANLSGIRITLE